VIARRIAVAAIWGVVAVFAGELLVRTFAPQDLQRDIPELWMQDPTLGWRHRPNAHVVANTGERNVEICTNGAGDRVDCHRPPPAHCAGRVLWLGNFEALSIPFAETPWSLLDADTGACTDAAGVTTYYMGQYIAAARERLGAPGAHWDVVSLAVYVGNDFTTQPEFVPPPQDMQHQPWRLLPAGLTVHDLWTWFYPYNSWLESRSQLYVASRTAIRRALDRGDVGIYGVPETLRRSKLTPALLDGTARGIVRVAQEAHRHGARFLLVLHPHRAQVMDPDGAKIVRAMPALAGDIDMNAATDELLSRLGTVPEIDATVDLLPVLREHADPGLWEPEDQHMSAAAYRIWAETVSPPLRELLAEGPPPS
jgi:hypothetical protein